MRQNENVSPGRIIMFEIFFAAMRMFTALFSWVTGSMPLPVLISTELYSEITTGNLKSSFDLANFSLPKTFLIFRPTICLYLDMV